MSSPVLPASARWAFWPADLQQLAAESARFPSAESLELLRKWGGRYLVVPPRLYERDGLASAQDVIARLDALQPRLTLIASDQRLRLYLPNAIQGP
jgi:hypothetical protein